VPSVITGPAGAQIGSASHSSSTDVASRAGFDQAERFSPQLLTRHQ
jgi:hypothetical protein